jgi:hypothetical protein
LIDFRFVGLSLPLIALVFGGCQGTNGAAVSAPNLPADNARFALGARHATVPDRLYIANANLTQYTGNVLVYSAGGASYVKTIAKTVSYPTTLLLNGTNLYVGDSEKDTVSVFDVTNGKLISTLSRDIGEPVSLAIDSSGALYVASIVYYNEGFIAVFNDGKFSHEITQGIHGLTYMAVDKAQNLYATNSLYGYNSVAVYGKGEKIPKYHIRKGIASPDALAIDSADDLYVCNGAAHDVSVYPSGSTSPSRTLETAAYPSAITLGKNGSVYVASTNSKEVDIFAPGATRPTVVISSVSGSSALAIDGRNNLYVANSAGVEVYDATTGVLERTLTENISQSTALALGT